MVLEKGQRFTLRGGGCTVGTGVISNIHPNLTPEQFEDLTMSKKKRDKKLAALAAAREQS